MKKCISVIAVGSLASNLKTERVAGRVHSIFGKIINIYFQGEQGMLSVSAGDTPMSPVHLRTNESGFQTLKIKEGDLAESKEALLSIGETSFDLHESKVYVSPLEAKYLLASANKIIFLAERAQRYALNRKNDQEGFIPLLPHIMQIYAGKNIEQIFPVFALQGYENISKMALYFKEKNKALFLQEALKLIGLGPGLTPSGDDFLSGFMIGYSACVKFGEKKKIFLKDAFAKVVEKAKGETNDISFYQLLLASKGYGNEMIDQLCLEILTGQEERIEELAEKMTQFGSTSGLDQLTGLLFGIGLGLEELALTNETKNWQ